jgi:hypothetical protein
MEDIDGPEGIRKTEGNIQGIGQTEINLTDENETKSRTKKTFGYQQQTVQAFQQKK